MFVKSEEWFRVQFLLFLVFTIKDVSGQLRQCCPPDSYLVEHTKMCSDSENKTRFNLNCKFGAIILDPNIDKDDTFFFDPAENVLLIDGYDGYNRTKEEFCLGKIQRNGSGVSENLVAIICLGSEGEEQNSISVVLRVLMFLSTLFLLVTLYIYTIIPNLRDLQGKCVIAFICSLIGAYITLLVVQTFPNSSQEACVMQAAALYFFMSASFFWNNVITFNIWKSVRNFSFKVKEKLWCTIYLNWGFGVPLLMVLLAFILEHVPGENHIRPRFAETKCWFKGRLESWSYFYGPISILLIINTFMFLQSSWTLWKNYRNSAASRIRSLRFKCVLYLKLFLLMGITWAFEVISFATDNNPNIKYLWFVTDCLNGSQGIIIFLILVVFRQKVRLGLLEKKLCNINWPQSWAKEEIQESSTLSFADDIELANQKSKFINESLK